MNIQVSSHESVAYEIRDLGHLRPADKIAAAAETAMRRIPPVWPLKDFVAVNPFLGLADENFADAAARLNAIAGARTLMPRAFYADALKNGRMTDDDLAAALALHRTQHKHEISLAEIKTQLQSPGPDGTRQARLVMDVAGEATGTDWTSIWRERISHWAASRFDEGQSLWASRKENDSDYSSWRAYAAADQTTRLLGAPGFASAAAALPSNPRDVLELCAARLNLRGRALVDHFHALLMGCGGWAGLARYRLWRAELKGATDTTLLEFLAALAGWELSMLEGLDEKFGLADAWRRDREAAAFKPSQDFVIDAIFQSAYEIAWQRSCIAQIERALPTEECDAKPLQAAFCIDVRSEVFRRALEQASPEVETIGFAGFFGVPVAYIPAGEESSADQCPVLLSPSHTICETASNGKVRDRHFLRAAAQTWKSFKISAVSSFSFVETYGWSYAAKLVTDSLGLTRPVSNGPREAGPPDLSETMNGHGIPAADQIAIAENILRGMSLTRRLGRLILLAGHGASVVNNPHAAGLDCGACGGHSGEVNARVAAAILNDASVRVGLAERGIIVSEQTHFIAGLHDTTTDTFRLFDEDRVPPSHADNLARLRDLLARAGETARAERAGGLRLIPGARLKSQIARRSRDWSQVRPEWGLAGCAAFIAAPRNKTADIDLGGRAFLHSYDWRTDKNFAVLELIMTAPMVVASWISLQYYGSTVDNRAFGAGNKVLHNVVSAFGVLEGAGGDLRTGLPMQSVHDGERFVHEPMRLSVFIAAPTHAIDRVLSNHPDVKDLVANGWLHLFALGENGEPTRRWVGDGAWSTNSPGKGGREIAQEVQL